MRIAALMLITVVALAPVFTAFGQSEIYYMKGKEITVRAPRCGGGHTSRKKQGTSSRAEKKYRVQQDSIKKQLNLLELKVKEIRRISSHTYAEQNLRDSIQDMHINGLDDLVSSGALKVHKSKFKQVTRRNPWMLGGEEDAARRDSVEVDGNGHETDIRVNQEVPPMGTFLGESNNSVVNNKSWIKNFNFSRQTNREKRSFIRRAEPWFFGIVGGLLSFGIADHFWNHGNMAAKITGNPGFASGQP